VTLDATVVVATFGEDHWRRLAATRAIPSARTMDVPVVHAHADTLHNARNSGLGWVKTEWVIYLDADDELEPGYIDAMAAGTADLRAPAVRYVHPGGRIGRPAMPRVAGHTHACDATCLPAGNWLVIGTCVRADMLRQVGGWWPETLYEDWSLWLRCYKAGATFEAAPKAVYRAHIRPSSRNRSRGMAERNRVHHEIIASVYPEGVPA
jgi:cellulose synthase/poly-beta-1,6-N-acetylglucosamine synthase-like glycosyltransferase